MYWGEGGGGNMVDRQRKWRSLLREMTLQEWGGGGLTVNGEFCPMGYHDILSFPLLPTPNRFLSVQVYKICIHNFQEINVHIYMIGFACNSQIPHARREVTLQEVGGGVLTVNGELCPMGYHILSFPLHPTPNRFLSVQVYKIYIHNFQEINVHI